MTRSTPITVVELDGPHLAAVRGRARAGRVVIERALRAIAPAEALPEELAGWVRDRLREGGLPRGRVVLSVPRAGVVFKVLPLPGEGLLEEERLEMVALQIGRQLTIPMEDAAIDSFELNGGAERRAVAAACHREHLEWARRTLADGGRTIGSADLRAGGVAALLPGERDGAMIAIAPGARTTEIALVVGGKPAFVRSIDANASLGDDEQDGADRVAARVAVEVKRTLASARATGVGEGPTGVFVVGDDDLGDRVRAACELEVGLRAETDAVEIAWPDGLSPEDRRILAPLAGVVRRRAAGIDGIDFLNPHRPPDRGARRRQLALVGVFVLITAVGLCLILSRARLDRLDREIETLSSRYSEQYAALAEMKALDARVTHAERWIAGDTDWLEHAAWVAEVMPGPDRATLDEISGRGGAQIQFARGPNIYPGTWSTTETATVRIAGRMRDRATGLELRRRLLDDTRYRVLTQGPDVDDRFSFDLITTDFQEDRP